MKKWLWLKRIIMWGKKNIAYILAVIMALAFTPMAIQYAALERGYGGAVGGEFLLIPFAILVTYFIKTIPKEMKEMWVEVNRDEETQ